MTHLFDTELLNSAIQYFGVDCQIDKMMEECGELIQAICKMRQDVDSLDKWDHVAEEVADVQIMVNQMKLILGEKNVGKYENEKLVRLQKRIREKEKEGHYS